MKKTVFLVALVMCITFLAAASYELEPAQTKLDVSKSSANLKIKVELDKLDYSNLEKADNSFTNIFVEDWHRTMQTGKPALPKLTKMIIVPQAGAHVKVLDVNYKNIELTSKPFPAQKLAVDSYDVPSPKFSYDEDFYRSKQVYPQKLYSVSPVHEMRGVHFVYLTVTPVQYLPANNSLRVAQGLELEITYNGSKFSDERLRSEYFDSIFAQKAINYDILQPLATSKQKEIGAELMIITTQEFTAAAEEFKDWKQQQGFTTDLAYVEDIGTTAMDIYFYIYAAYHNWEQPPSFLMILGDVEYVPTNYIPSMLEDGNLGTDRVYTCMDGYDTGDYHPDIAYGRMSVDAEEAEAVVEKVINYEKYPPQISSFYQDATICSFFQDYDDYNSYEDRRFVKTCEETRDFLLDEGYDAERIYVTESSVTPLYYNNGYYANGEPLPDELLRENGFAWDGNSTDISNAINDGTFMVYHRDHGYPGGWGDPAFNIGNVNSLQNGNLLPFVFSMNCASGHFDMETDEEAENYESFSEEFLRKADGGAASLISACRNSLSGYNDFLALGMIDSMWEDFYPNFNYAESNGYMGTVLLAGFAAMEEFWYSQWSRYQMDIFHVMGDPTLQIWRQEPQEITAAHNTSFTIAETTIPVSANITQGTAAVTYNGELLGVKKFQNSEFDVELFENLAQPAIVQLTITARDHRAYTSNLSFIPSSGGYVVLDNFGISDVNGNDDGDWDAGEDLDFTLQLSNAGNEAISGSEITLSADTEYLNLTETSFILDEMQPEQTAQVELTGQLSMNCSHAQLVELIVQIANNENDYINSGYIQVTKQPKLATDLESVELESLEQVTYLPYTLQNIGAEELQIELVNASNKAVDISDENSYLKIPHSEDFNDLDEMSIAFWMKTLPNNNLGFAVSKGVSLMNSSFIIAPLSTSSFNYYVWDTEGNRHFKVISADLDYEEWNHICLSVSETDIKVFFNGELVSTEPFTSPIWNSEEDIFIGCDQNENFQFDGHVDELAFYNQALTQEEVQQNMQNTYHGDAAGLISYFRLDEQYFISDMLGQNNAINVGEVSFDAQGPNITTWMGAEQYNFLIGPYETVETNLVFNPFSYEMPQYNSEYQLYSNAVNLDELIVPVQWDNSTANEAGLTPIAKQQLNIYPNPFNPETKLQFILEKTQQVSLEIYNVKGRKVKTLLKETEMTAGNHAFTWKGYDNANQKVGSGVYFAVMKTSLNGVSTQKMLMLK